ncbi:diguanylate cyclase [Psychrobacillus sp. FJAT-51614]|uniref:Diguanylate cyclase n=1 Tax=Psychrobacillus mangrovi TaxID=3117745 RepID=A0ABU8EZP2_9BACI
MAFITSNQFRLLYDLSDDYVFLMRKLDDTFIYECINKKAEEVFSTNPIGKKLEDCLDEYHYMTIINNYKRAFIEKKSIFYQDHFSISNLTHVNETTAIPIFDGEAQYILAVTKKVARSKEMRASTYILESYKKGINEAALVAMTNQNGIIEMVNQVFEDTCQFKQDEIVGKTFRMINSNFHDEKFFKQMWDTVREGSIWRGEIRNRTKSGSFYWVDANVIPIMNEHGEIEKYLTIQFNITDKKRIIDELRNIERTFTLITEYSNDLIAITDEEGYLLYSSPSHETILQYDKEELLGTYYLSLISEDRVEGIRHLPSIDENSIYRTELLMKKKNGNTIWADTSITEVKRNRDEEQEKWFVVVSREITEKRELEDKLKFMAYHDSLTGLPNRRSFHNDLPIALETASGENNIALIYIDGDDFKSVNDKFGHDVGDQFLIRFAEKLQQSVNYQFTCYRLGGDEFVIIVDGVEDYIDGGSDKIMQLIHSIQNTLKIGWSIGEQLFTPTSSIGISIYPHDGKSVDELLDKADQALYAAKKLGKNNFLYTNAVQC